MLAQLDPDELGRLWFPLGESTKTEVRAEAEAAGLAAARRAESQEACFLAGGDYRDFLGAHGVGAAEGAIVDEDGNELGRHDGYWRFTPGPAARARRLDGRAGVRAAQRPRDEHGRRRAARLARPSQDLLAGGPPLRPGRARRREAALPLAGRARRASRASGDGFDLQLDAPAYGVAPGQAAVLYEGDAVVGAGLISSAE